MMQGLREQYALDKQLKPMAVAWDREDMSCTETSVFKSAQNAISVLHVSIVIELTWFRVLFLRRFC